MLRHWYIYWLTDPRTESIIYIGKGYKNRLRQSLRQRIKEYGYLVADKMASFWDEQAAYDCEREMIAEYKPILNRNPGGGGSYSGRAKNVTSKSIDREDARFYRECEKYGTQWMACKVLMKYLGYFPRERALAIQQRYYDGLKSTEKYRHGQGNY